MAELRMVLVGKTGNGKSSSGNIILGRRAFRTTVRAVHEGPFCQRERVEFEGKTLTVVDTPGLMELGQNEEEVKTEITRCISLCSPGPHVFLLVINPVRLTRDDEESAKQILRFFGQQAANYIMILFTHGDELAEAEAAIEDILLRYPTLKSLIHQYGGEYHVFNNEEEDRSQVRELLHKITLRNRRNGGRYYTREMLEDEDAEEENICNIMLLGGLMVSALGGLVLVAMLAKGNP